MKIRIKSNSLRYRLTRSDISVLVREGYLEEKADFGEQSLVYSLKCTDDSGLSATFENNTIAMLIPKKMVAELADTERVGFENNTGTLHLLIEKDFTCLDNVAEDQSDNYPNPLAGKI